MGSEQNLQNLTIGWLDFLPKEPPRLLVSSHECWPSYRGNATVTASILQGQVYTTSYSHDLAGQLTLITYPSGRVTGINTSASAGQPVETVVASLNYTAIGPTMGWTHGNGLVTTATYDADFRLTQLHVEDTATVMHRYMEYNLADYITSIYGDNWGAYGLDALYRLADVATQDVGGTWSFEMFGYDAIGNRSTVQGGASGEGQFQKSYDYETTSNRLLSLSEWVGGTLETTIYGYDGNGNITSKDGHAGSYLYDYGENNRLQRVEKDTVLLADYAHNALGQRVIKTRSGGTPVHFVYDEAGRLLAESQADGTVIREYLYLDDLLIGVIADDGVSGLALYYVHTDHLGTPLMVTDAAQNTVWQAAYRAFGLATVTVDTIELPIRFPGQYFDEETGLHYNYFRDYDPSLGRYVQSDPIGLDGGLNTYAYAEGNSVQYSDPTGENARTIAIAACAGYFLGGTLKGLYDLFFSYQDILENQKFLEGQLQERQQCDDTSDPRLLELEKKQQRLRIEIGRAKLMEQSNLLRDQGLNALICTGIAEVGRRGISASPH